MSVIVYTLRKTIMINYFRLDYYYWLIGRPVIGTYGKWYKYIIPKRLTFKSDEAIYKWLWFNFSWEI